MDGAAAADDEAEESVRTVGPAARATAEAATTIAGVGMYDDTMSAEAPAAALAAAWGSRRSPHMGF